MEPRFKLEYEGQELRRDDIHSVSGNAALADDRVLWELLRLLPYNVAGPQKAVLTYGVDGWAKPSDDNSTALVHPDPGGGYVRVRPHREIVSSLTAPATSKLESIRGIRSGTLLPNGSVSYYKQAIAVNASSDPRWTLVYGKIEPDAAGDSATVKKKDPLTKVVGDQSVTLNTKTTVTIGTANGTAAVTPTRPALPADAAGAYYIPLAYVLVPGNFDSSTVLDREAIYEVAPVITLHSALGGVAAKPANQSHVEDGTVDTNQSGADPTVSTFRPGAYLPPTMVGGEERIIPIQNHLAPLSHADGDVVDDSVDWRFRFFEWSAYAKTGNTSASAFASDRQGTGTSLVPSAWNSAYGTSTIMGMGQSFVDDTGVGAVFSVADGNGVAAILKGGSGGATAIGGATDIVMLYVRDTDGALIIKFNGTPDAQILVRLRASAPYSNFGLLS